MSTGFRFGENDSQNARAWKMKDRIKLIDQDTFEGWNDTLSMLLVFAGLFSATCTAFLIEATKNLQPDWQRATSLAVYAIYVQINSTSHAPFEVPNPQSFASPSSARWINGLWFTSLTLSLAVSMLAILAKQWLNEFKRRTNVPAPPKQWMMRYCMLKDGLDRWGMDTYISTLPLLLHASLFLFLAGLYLLLVPLDDYLARVVIVMTVILAIFYVAAGIAPAFWSVCPSVTPMLRCLYTPLRMALLAAFRVVLITVYAAFRLLVTGLWFLVATISVMLEISTTIVCCMCIWTPGTPFMDFFYRFHSAVALFLPSFLDRQVISSSPPHAPCNDMSPTVRAILEYRSPTAVVPAFDQLEILAGDEPILEASILAQVIQSFPVEEEVQAALCAIGSLSLAIHVDYFHQRKLVSPLAHKAVFQAAVDTLDAIAAGADATDEIVAKIIRACLFLAQKPLRLAPPTKHFLSRYSTSNAHDLSSLSLATIHSGAVVPRDAALQPANMGAGTIELLALSASRGRPCPRGILWVAVNAPEIILPPFPESFISTLESDILNDEECRQSGWKPRMDDDRRLRLITALDTGLRHSHASRMYTWERHALSTIYGAAVRSIAYDVAIDLPRDLHNRLCWTTTKPFSYYDLSVADLNALGTLLVRVNPEGRTCIPPEAVFNLLRQFERRSLPVSPETLEWIQKAFELPADSGQLVAILQSCRSAKAALFNSHLSLLRPVAISHKQKSRSPWDLLLNVVSIPDTARLLVEMACAYTVLLLILHRRGYSTMAQVLLRELLPCERAIAIIAHGALSRYHLVLHARLISQAWWMDVRERLMQPEAAQSWVPCTEFADSVAFVTALSAETDCLDCAHDDIRIPWGTAPMLPDPSQSNTNLTAHSSAIWEPPEHTVADDESPLYTRVARHAMRHLSNSRHASLGNGQQPDDMLESGGLVRALTLKVAMVR